MKCRGGGGQEAGRLAGGWAPPLITAALAVAVLLLLASCKGVRNGQADGTPLEAPPYATLAEAHNARIDRLGTVYARGVIEIRWTDEDGKHFEQGDVDLWIALPQRTALNITKFGERLMWLGSNDRRAWLFDFRGDETVLHVAADEQAPEDETADRLPIQPATLLRLCGLARLPQAQPSPPVQYDPDHDAWVVALKQFDELTRVLFDRRTLLPVRVEALDGDGRVLLHSRIELDRYETVEIAGTSPLARPKFPTLIDISERDGTGMLKIAVRSPTDEVKDRYFDLNWLTGALRPERIEGPWPDPTSP